jgi:hypothetical protein
MIPSAILYGTFSIGNVNELTYDETLCSQKAGTQSLTWLSVDVLNFSIFNT